MTTCNSMAKALSPAMGLVGNGSFIYVLRFSSDERIHSKEFCDQAQEILYDDLGCPGHFRIAPKHRKDLNENFILCARSEQPPQFIQREENELFVSFIIRDDCSPDTPLSEELSIIPDDVQKFCDSMGVEFAWKRRS